MRITFKIFLETLFNTIFPLVIFYREVCPSSTTFTSELMLIKEGKKKNERDVSSICYKPKNAKPVHTGSFVGLNVSVTR